MKFVIEAKDARFLATTGEVFGGNIERAKRLVVDEHEGGGEGDEVS